ncbi:Glutathione-binding protein GsiB [Anaerolineae bacterium]|nr:Glutathione-binding protein GsiB [Anaerolineae bacterium]
MNVKYLRQILAASFLVLAIAACAPATTPTAVPPAPTVAKPTTAPTAAPAATVAPTTAPAATTAPTAAPVATSAPQPTATQAAAAPQGSLIVGLGNIPGTGDPHKFVAPPSAWLNYLVFDALFENDDKYEQQPALAESYKIVSPTVWEFKLRPGVKFQNGDALTSADVKFSFDRVLSSGGKLPQQARVLTITKVEAVDNLTVRFTTDKADPLFLKRIASHYIIPQKYFDAQKEDGFGKAPIGTGPFKVTELTPDNQVVLEAYTGSWRGAPKVAKVVWKVIREPATRVNALKTGEIDIAQAIPPDQIAGLKSAGVQVLPVARAQVQTVAFNTAQKDSPLAKKEVRQALNYAVDKQALVDALLTGFSNPANGQIVGPDSFGYNPDLKPYAYDAKKAKQMLADAGYPNGFTMKMEATVGNFPNDKQLYEAVASYLSDAGVKVDFKVIELSVWLKEFYSLPDQPPMFVQGLQYLPFMDSDLSLGWYSCSQAEATRRFCNDAFEAKLTASRAEMDPQKRLKLLQEANAILREEAPALFLYQLSDIWGLSSKVSGLAPRADAVLTLERVVKK